MFLVKDERYGVTSLVFTWEDPRRAGFRGQVAESVSLDYDMEAVHAWADGDERPEACVGRAPDNPNHYKVFRYSRDMLEQGYHLVLGTPVVFGSWNEYARLHLIPPDPEQTKDDQWYDYLDRVDDASRGWRQRTQITEKPTANTRDEVAAWVATKHLIVDTSISQVLYLPQGSPPEEIRLIEVNDRLPGNGERVEPIDYGLDIEGVDFRLFVADLTTDELDQLKRDPTRLPPGWVQDGATQFKRNPTHLPPGWVQDGATVWGHRG